MKKFLLGFCLMIMSFGLFAQNEIANQFVAGEITKEQFVLQMSQMFDEYNLNADQADKITALAEKKAENYMIIAALKAKDENLFLRKMASQAQHTTQSLQFILDEDQFKQYMIKRRLASTQSKK